MLCGIAALYLAHNKQGAVFRLRRPKAGKVLFLKSEKRRLFEIIKNISEILGLNRFKQLISPEIDVYTLELK